MAFVKYNYTAAFVAWLNGTPVEEISHIYSIPIDTLKTHMREEQWGRLQEHLPLVTNQLMTTGQNTELQKAGKDVDAKMELVKRNRDENFELACKLRKDLTGVVDRLLAGELKLERQWCHKGNVTRTEVDPTIIDRVNLAAYARTIADLTYQALGDRGAVSGAKDGLSGDGASGTPAITIILPGAIAAPREQRGESGPVIDLRPEAVEAIKQG